MMKRRLAVLLSIVLAAMSIGCGAKESAFAESEEFVAEETADEASTEENVTLCNQISPCSVNSMKHCIQT